MVGALHDDADLGRGAYFSHVTMAPFYWQIWIGLECDAKSIHPSVHKLAIVQL